MNRDEMLRLFEAHREAEAARDVDAILGTFVEDCFLETLALGLRAEGKDAVKAAYEAQYFVAFPDLDPDDQGMAFGDDVMVVWGLLRGTSKGEWLGVPPRRGFVLRAVCQCRSVQRRPDGRGGGLLRPRHALRAGRSERGCRSRSGEGKGLAELGSALIVPPPRCYMSQSLVYVDTSTVREGALPELKEAIRELAEFVEENEPRLISYSVYFSHDEREMSVVHVHADAASLDHHMDVAGPRFGRFADLVTLRSIQVYGDPSERALSQLRDKVRLLGAGEVVLCAPHAGFSRGVERGRRSGAAESNEA